MSVKAIAMIHNDKGMEAVEGVIVTGMTHEDYIVHINRMRREMMRMEKEYNALLDIARTLERQRNRLLKEKYSMIEEELHYSYRRLFGK